MILLPYFETIAQYRSGIPSKGNSLRAFREEFLSVVKLDANGAKVDMQTAERIADSFYIQVRCGLLHSSSPKQLVILSDRWPDPIMILMNSNGKDIESIEVHPEKFLELVNRKLFPTYLSELNDPANEDLRSKFLMFYDFQG